MLVAQWGHATTLVFIGSAERPQPVEQTPLTLLLGPLEMLLAGSHLIFRVINPKTIKICWAGSNAN